MKQDELEALCKQGLSLRAIAKCEAVSMSTVRHCLRKYGLKTRRGPHGKTPKDLMTPRRCGRCGEIDPTKFYGHKLWMCATCHNRYNLERGRETRLKAIAHLGGCCGACGFDRYASALDVHHLDPAKKDPDFNTMRYWSWGAGR